MQMNKMKMFKSSTWQSIRPQAQADPREKTQARERERDQSEAKFKNEEGGQGDSNPIVIKSMKVFFEMLDGTQYNAYERNSHFCT